MFEPVTSVSSDKPEPPVEPTNPEMSGSPSFAVSTIVPDSPAGDAFSTATSSCAAVLAASLGCADAFAAAVVATEATAMAAAIPAGRSQRRRREARRVMSSLSAANRRPASLSALALSIVTGSTAVAS